MKKAVLNITDPIFSHLAIEGSLLRDCLIASRWDDKNNNSISLAHYNIRLAVSKLLQEIKSNSADTECLVTLLTSESKILTKSDVFQGFRSAEVVLKNTQSNNRARTYSIAFRSFIKKYSSVLFGGTNPFKFYYESIFVAGSKYLKNTGIRSFEIETRDTNKKSHFVNPDLLPTLFKKNSVLHHMLQNMEARSKESPLEYSIVAGLKAQLRYLNDRPNSALIKKLLKTTLELVKSDSIITALQDYEHGLYAKYPHKKLHQVSVKFRHCLFTYALTTLELIAEKNKFKTSFNKFGKLKFKPKYIISTLDQNYVVDGFQLGPLLPVESVCDICFESLEQRTKNQPVKAADVTNLVEILMIIEQNDYIDARRLFAKKPQDLERYHVVKGLKEIEDIIISSFPSQKMERFTLVKNFLNQCNAATKNGNLISEIQVDSLITPKNKCEILPIKAYSKTNGKKKSYIYEFNITKIEKLLNPGGTLALSLNALKLNSTTQIPGSHLSNIELTLGYIVAAEKNDAIRHILTSSITKLNQRDFRLGFSQLEDIIDAQDINIKAHRSQAIRTFLNSYAGKINGQIAIKNCGFSTRFSSADENNAQKLIDPVDKKGEILISPIFERHLSLDDLKNKVREFLVRPIDNILEACKTEIAHYIKLVTSYTIYTSVDEKATYNYQMPEEVSAIVIENQQNEGRKLKKTKLSLVRERYTNEALLGAYVRHQIFSGLTSTTFCLEKTKLIPSYITHWFPPTGTGMKDLFWSSVFLPKNILLVCFIRLTLRTTWNKDVISTLTRSDLPESLLDGAFTIIGFKDKVAKNTASVTIEPHEREIREAISLLIQHHDNMVCYGLKPESLWDTPNSKKLSFLTASAIDNFREHYTLPYFRMELLAKHQINLRKGIDGDVLKSQMERNHGSIRTTAGYLSHPIAQLEYDANNADFQRRFETTVQFRDKKESLEKYGFDPTNVDTDLLIAPAEINDEFPDWFLLPNGSSCTDIFASVDKSKKDSICRGRTCHKGEGCEFNRVEIGIEEFVYTLRHQAYYLSRGMALLDKHGRDYFDEFIAPDMRFTFGLAKYVEFANPFLFKQAKRRLADAQ